MHGRDDRTPEFLSAGLLALARQQIKLKAWWELRLKAMADWRSKIKGRHMLLGGGVLLTASVSLRVLGFIDPALAAFAGAWVWLSFGCLKHWDEKKVASKKALRVAKKSGAKNKF